MGHPDVEIVALTGESKAGKSIDEVYPHLAGYGLPSLVRIEDVSLTGLLSRWVWQKGSVAEACGQAGSCELVDPVPGKALRLPTRSG